MAGTARRGFYSYCCVFLLMLAVHWSDAQPVKKDGCKPCDPESCPRPVGCLAGMVYDYCGCCHVCGRIEGEKCNNDTLQLPYKHIYGYCGEELECRLRTDLQPSDPPEAICFCKQDEILCASDGKTYMNMCQMMEEAYRQRNTLNAVTRGPCKSVPWVVSGPEDQKAVRGTNVALSCEGMGYPIPSIEWQLTRTNGLVVALPSDDQHIATQARGGPERFELTAWLQILNFQDEDIGTYDCIVRNNEGEAKASASIDIVESKDELDDDDENIVDTN